MKNIVILGSTGSIGTQSLDVIRQWPERFKAVGLSSCRRIDELTEQARQFKPSHVAVMDGQGQAKAGCLESEGIQVHCGLEGLTELATLPEAGTVVVATVGAVGLKPTLEAIRAGKNIALANKEVLVMAGELMMREAVENGVTLLPIDSEHSAIMQCLVGGCKKEIRRIIVTASGGPFRGRSLEEIRNTSVAEALDHPTWNMGPKISIDSASLMNKGLEVIECYHLFGVRLDQIEVLVHPQSIVHSMVEFVDGSIIAQLASTDMRLPIQYSLSYPERLESPSDYIDLAAIGQLTFEQPDRDSFPCLELAYESLRRGGTAPAVLSVANEVAVEAFLKEKIGFLDIARVIENALETQLIQKADDLDTILEVEQQTRSKLRSDLLGEKTSSLS